MNTGAESSAIIPTTYVTASIPRGEYHVTLTKAAKVGNILTASFQAIRGPYAGQNVFATFDHSSQSDRAFLYSLCYAAGKENVTDTSQLEGRPVLAKVQPRSIDGQKLPFITSFAPPIYREGAK